MTNKIYSLIVLFVAVFVIGFLPGPSNLFLLPLMLYFGVAMVLLSLTLRSVVGGRLKRFLLLTGCSAVGFSAGVLYGAAGMWGFYSINDPVFLTLVIGSTVGFAVGTAGSLASSRGR